MLIMLNNLKVGFSHPLKLQKHHVTFGYDSKILLVNHVAGFFTFDLLDLLKVHYCRFENLSMCLGSFKNNTLKISHS